VWYVVDMVGVVDAKQVMTCKATSVMDMCMESEAGHQGCESHQLSIHEEWLQPATQLPQSATSSASTNVAKHVRRVCDQLKLQRKKCFMFYNKNANVVRERF